MVDAPKDRCSDVNQRSAKSSLDSLPGVETIQAASNHVLHNLTASGPAFAASRLVIAEAVQA